jgi:hypothetical protein|tara:strand:- start:2573 stop:2737 length:165 start_codon:yes stop_codon:yes gene_type:complete
MCEMNYAIICTDKIKKSAQHAQANDRAQITASNGDVESVPFVLAGFRDCAQSQG